MDEIKYMVSREMDSRSSLMPLDVYHYQFKKLTNPDQGPWVCMFINKKLPNVEVVKLIHWKMVKFINQQLSEI